MSPRSHKGTQYKGTPMIDTEQRVQTQLELTGKTIPNSFLTAEDRGPDYVDAKGHRSVRWWFHCRCGTRKLLLVRSVLSGTTKSCGCWGVEKRRQLTRHAFLTHRVGSAMSENT